MRSPVLGSSLVVQFRIHHFLCCGAGSVHGWGVEIWQVAWSRQNQNKTALGDLKAQRKNVETYA